MVCLVTSVGLYLFFGPCDGFGHDSDRMDFANCLSFSSHSFFLPQVVYTFMEELLAVLR